MAHPYSAAAAPTRWRDPISSARAGAPRRSERGGARYQAGDSEVAFTIQSNSKPFVLALALGVVGADAVGARVGSEPSGGAFNPISLEPGTGRPVNPIVNTGAIVNSSLVAASGPTGRFERIHHCRAGFAGRHLDVDGLTSVERVRPGITGRLVRSLTGRAAGSGSGSEPRAEGPTPPGRAS